MAQTQSVRPLYLAGEFYASGTKTNLNKSHLALLGPEVEIGYRFKNNLSLFLPVAFDVCEFNSKTTKNYSNQAALGLGMSYVIPFKNGEDDLELLLSGSSTVLNEDVDYFKAKFSARWGLTTFGCVVPFVGLGFAYLTPYHHEVKNAWMFNVSVGIRFN